MATQDQEELTKKNLIKKYLDLFPKYTQYAATLNEVLTALVSTLDFEHEPEVSARAKGIANFAEKIYRPGKKYGEDALTKVTDLCGGRVMTYTIADRDAVCHLIENNFEVNWADSQGDERNRSNEFGYRSIHYIVRFKNAGPGKGPALFESTPPPGDPTAATQTQPQRPPRTIKIPVPDVVWELENGWAEVQVRSMLSHVWATLGHDVLYKSPFPIPDRWTRETAGVSSNLEQADETFSRVLLGVKSFDNIYGSGLSGDSKERVEAEYKGLDAFFQEQYKVLEEIVKDNKKNPSPDLVVRRKAVANTLAPLALKVAKLANATGNYPRANAILDEGLIFSSIDGAELKELGLAALGKGEFLFAENYLKKAATYPKCDVATLLALAESCRMGFSFIDSARVSLKNPTYQADRREGSWKTYSKAIQRAFRADPDDPAVLCAYIERLLNLHGNTTLPLSEIIQPLQPTLAIALRRAGEQAEIGVNVPWVFAHAGIFSALLGEYHGNAEEHFARLAQSKDTKAIELAQRMTKLIGKFNTEGFNGGGNDCALSKDRRPLLDAILDLGLAKRGEPKNTRVLFLVGKPADHEKTITPLLGYIDKKPNTVLYVTDELLPFVKSKLPPVPQVPQVECKLSGANWDGFARVFRDVLTSGVQPGNIYVISFPTTTNGATTGCRIAMAVGAKVAFWNGENLNLNLNLVKKARDHEAKRVVLMKKKAMIEQEISKLGELSVKVLGKEEEAKKFLNF